MVKQNITVCMHFFPVCSKQEKIILSLQPNGMLLIVAVTSLVLQTCYVGVNSISGVFFLFFVFSIVFIHFSFSISLFLFYFFFFRCLFSDVSIVAVRLSKFSAGIFI